MTETGSKHPRAWALNLITQAATPRHEEMRRAAGAARELTDELVRSQAPEDVMAEVADLIERAVTLLAANEHGRPYLSIAEPSLLGDRLPEGTTAVVAVDATASPSAAADASGFLEFSPLVGPSNPVAPPLLLHAEGDEVRGTGVFGAAYEGPPGHVHGGFIAAAFDEVLGFTQSFSEKPGMTGRLTVHYRKPTPLHRTLSMRGWIEKIEGRKIFTKGTIHDGDVLCAEAEGLFISIDFGRLAEYAANRDRSAPPPV